MTSIRSIAEIGGIKLLLDSLKPFGVMFPTLFWRLPSIKIKVYSGGIPRIRILSVPVLPAVGLTSTPSTPRKASANEFTRLDLRSS